MMDSNKQNLIKEIDFFILEGYQSYLDLSPADKHVLVAFYMHSMGKYTFECISESDYLDSIIGKLKDFIYCGSTTKAFELAETMQESAEQYLSKTLQELYAERVSIINADLNREAGLKPYQHKDNGETTWIRA